MAFFDLPLFFIRTGTLLPSGPKSGTQNLFFISGIDPLKSLPSRASLLSRKRSHHKALTLSLIFLKSLFFPVGTFLLYSICIALESSHTCYILLTKSLSTNTSKGPFYLSNKEEHEGQFQDLLSKKFSNKKEKEELTFHSEKRKTWSPYSRPKGLG